MYSVYVHNDAYLVCVIEGSTYYVVICICTVFRLDIVICNFVGNLDLALYLRWDYPQLLAVGRTLPVVVLE